MKIYRRRVASNLWHFSKFCAHWPEPGGKKFVEQTKKPTEGELCWRCGKLHPKWRA